MQNSSNEHVSLQDQASALSDAHHDVLSTKPVKNDNLLQHLQTGLPDPLSLLLNENNTLQSGLLGDIALQPLPLLEREGLATESTVSQPVPLASPCRLSRSLLWKIQEDYYTNKGIHAWADNVPSFITSSAYIAEAYAETVLAFLDDYSGHLNMDEPVYILELATGSGRFSHLMLRELDRKIARFSKFDNLKLKYVMTDFTSSNPDYWQAHDKFKPFVDSGKLDFAVYNPLSEDSLTLRISQENLASGKIKNPVIAIANYFFDTIPLDMFQAKAKTLSEGLVTIKHKPEFNGDPDAFPGINDVEVSVRYEALHNTRYYEDPKMNAVLNQYRHEIKNGSFLMPTGAFDVIRNLKAMANNQLVLISSDKAYTHVEDMSRFYAHDYAIHGGAFSYMVNYDAIGQYCKNDGGRYFHTSASNLSIQTVCCINVEQSEHNFERLNYVFQEKIDRSNLINTVCTLMPGRSVDNPVAKFSQVLAHLRLNLADPKIFFALSESLVELIPQGLVSQQKDLLKLMDEAWANYYYTPGETNLPFWFSQLYSTMGMHSESNNCLDKTIELFGPHEALYFLKGKNFEHLKQNQLAKAAYHQSLTLNPEFEESLNALKAMGN